MTTQENSLEYVRECAIKFKHWPSKLVLNKLCVYLCSPNEVNFLIEFKSSIISLCGVMVGMLALATSEIMLWTANLDTRCINFDGQCKS